MAHFGFVPSEHLLIKIQEIIQKKNHSEALYPLRDEIALLINQEIIQVLLTRIIADFPQSEKRETAEKLAQFIESSVATLLKQLLGKAPNKTVQQSIQFSKKSLFKKDNVYHIGQHLESHITINLKENFNQLQQGKKVDLILLSEHYKLFADETIRYYMHDFYQTLDLGMIKKKIADMGCTAIRKAVHIAIDKIIPRLNKEELKIIASHHDKLFFNEP